MTTNTEAMRAALEALEAQEKISRIGLLNVMKGQIEAATYFRTSAIALLRAALAQAEQRQMRDEFGEGWENLAWHLCAEENGEEACNELIWEGGPIPEPWGDRWLKYEGEAKRMIALVREYAPAAAQPEELQPVIDAVAAKLPASYFGHAQPEEPDLPAILQRQAP